MEILLILGDFFVGLGVLLLGCAAIWYVSTLDEKDEKDEKG